jgi:hypothetical protein
MYISFAIITTSPCRRGNGYIQVWKQDGWHRDGSAGKSYWYIFGEAEAAQAQEAGWQMELVAAGMSHVNGALLQYNNNYYVGREVTVHFIQVHVKLTRVGQPEVRGGDQRYARAHVAGVHPWVSPTTAIDGTIAVDHLRTMTKRKRATMDTAVVPSSFPPHDHSVVQFAHDVVQNFDTSPRSDGAAPNPTTTIAELEFAVFLPKGFLDTVAKTLMFKRFELDVINLKHKALVGVVRPFAQVPPSNELQNELRSIVIKSNQDRPDGLDVHATAAEIRRALHGGCRDFALLQQVEGLAVTSSEAHRFAEFVLTQGTMHKLGMEGNAFLQQVGRARNPPQELALEMLPGTGGCPEKTTAALCTVLKVRQTYGRTSGEGGEHGLDGVPCAPLNDDLIFAAPAPKRACLGVEDTEQPAVGTGAEEAMTEGADEEEGTLAEEDTSADDASTKGASAVTLRTNLHNFTDQELQARLDSLRLPTDGDKDALIDRLVWDAE